MREFGVRATLIRSRESVHKLRLDCPYGCLGSSEISAEDWEGGP